jgi:hypothetical protein
MVFQELAPSDPTFHRSGENTFFCVIDPQWFDVLIVSGEKGTLKIELTQSKQDRKLDLSAFTDEKVG